MFGFIDRFMRTELRLAVLVLGVFAGAANAQTQPRSGDAFGDWKFTCRAIAESQTICTLNQTLISEDTNQSIAQFRIVRSAAEEGALALVAVLPLGVVIPAGVRGQVDDGEVFEMPLQTCLNNGCVSRTALSTEVLDALKRGQRLNVSFNLVRNANPIVLPVSLNGLTRGLEATGF